MNRNRLMFLVIVACVMVVSGFSSSYAVPSTSTYNDTYEGGGTTSTGSSIVSGNMEKSESGGVTGQKEQSGGGEQDIMRDRGNMHDQDRMQGGQCPMEQKPVNSIQEARDIANKYVIATQNDLIKVGSVNEKKDNYEVMIVTKKENAVVDKFFIDKKTGQMLRKQ